MTRMFEFWDGTDTQAPRFAVQASTLKQAREMIENAMGVGFDADPLKYHIKFYDLRDTPSCECS